MIYLIVVVENQQLLHILSACERARVCVALVIQHAKCICRITFPSVSSPPLPDFSTLPHKRNDFRKKLLKLKCVCSFSLQLRLKHFSF